MVDLSAELTLRTLDGDSLAIGADTIDGLKSRLGGSLITPRSADYDEVRQIWNAMIDRRPGLIVRCAGTADVLACVRFARDHRLLTLHPGGRSQHRRQRRVRRRADDRFEPMKSVRVDPGTAPPGRAGRHPGRFRPGSAGLRPRDTAWHQLHHRGGRADAGRRFRLAQPQIRHDRR